MKEEDENIMDKAVEAIRNDQIPPGPPQELVDKTLAKLADIRRQSDTPSSGRVVNLVGRIGAIRGITKFAAAAVLLVVAGYAVGRVSAPRPPDIEQLLAVLEPAIRRNVVAQLRNDLQSGLATCYDRLSDELGRQHSEDMARFASQTLEASNTVTSELLRAVIENINTAQTEDRKLFAAAIERIELERRRDTAALASVAVQTEDKVQRMQQGMAQLLSHGLPDDPPTYEVENSDNPVERRDK